MSDPNRRIYPADIHGTYCFKGARPWFEAKGLSWSDFVSSGISQKELEKLNDPFANRILQKVREGK